MKLGLFGMPLHPPARPKLAVFKSCAGRSA
jgi:hypothetical protein